MKPETLEKLENSPIRTKKLHLQSERLEEIPSKIESLVKLQYLDLFNNKINILPDWFFKLNRLKKINLKNNRFSKFPFILSSINTLSAINLSNNKIDSLESKVVARIFTINEIDLSFNKLTDIPDAKISSAQITKLNLEGNKISNFPIVIRKARTLKTLNLSNNQIHSFSENDFHQLTSLEELDLSYNKIEYLPSSISSLKKLKRLILSGNKISNLPREFEELGQLESLDLSGNPITKPPLEIINQGPKSTINYYLSLGENDELYEAKLLLVGQGNVGKTFLMNRLIHNKTPTTNTTEGIDIKNWIISTLSTENFRINVWDFGGQEIYHSTHQFFLTKRSLYLLIWEARSNQQHDSFSYWLNVIKLLSNNSPVIIILNKIDERISYIDERALKKSFKNIQSFHQVSALTGENIQKLQQEISETIDSLPLIGDKLPKVWMEIRDELEKLSENYITTSRYLKICNRKGLSNTKGEFLSQYFHDLGVFLHFQEEPVLRDIVFLKPEWATNAVYKILDSKEVIKNSGEFTITMLDSILTNYERDRYFYLVELMKKFEICFEFEKNKYLVPALLSPEKKEFDWDYENNLRFEYHYDFMPAGIIARFIVRIRKLVFNKTFWQNGVIIQREDTRALIESDIYLKKIRIWIKGKNPTSLLEIIRNELTQIHNSLNHYNVPEKVPCICPRCKDDSLPHLFKYDVLRGLNGRGRKTIPCELSYEGVNIHKILQLYKIDDQPTEYNDRYSLDKVLYDLIEISSRVLERKNQFELEDSVNDFLSDLLRTKGHQISDQTRSGSSQSGKQPGELDIMIRKDNGMPVTIIETFRVNSCGSKNTVISNHINKLLSKYDTHGIARNFVIILSEAKQFDKQWINYIKYIKDINNKPEYNDEDYPLENVITKADLSEGYQNMKICVSQHSHMEFRREIFHIFLNMY